ncbi:MAG: SH3 beta-barrel fold-containing protein [Nitrososphaerales archaeon]
MKATKSFELNPTRPTMILNSVQDFKNFVGVKDFSVTYRKASGKEAGRFRMANANVAAVKQHVKGTGSESAAETRNDRGIVVYFDLDKSAIRSFALDTIIKLTVNGQTYSFGL